MASEQQPRWDVIALSAMDDGQKSAFEKQLQSSTEWISRIADQFRVFADEPKGVKIGGGGATLSIVHRLHAEFGPRIFSFHILLIHAGGFSQRQPNASVLGKLFIPLPIKNADSDDRPYNLFEMKLRSYAPLLRRMGCGVFMAASDTLEYLGDPKQLVNEESIWTMDGDGFVALAHPSSLEIGRQHGVYVLDEAEELAKSKMYVYEARCRRVLQKPSVDAMKREGAVVMAESSGGGGDRTETVFTDSAYFVSSSVVRKLLDIYDHLSPLNCELDAYGDFLQPLGTEANDEYLRGAAVNALIQNDQLATARRYLFESLKEFPLKVLVFAKSRFYHLGTFGESLDYFCRDGTFRRDFEAETRVFSSTVGDSKRPSSSSSSCVISSMIGDHFVSHDSTQVHVEYCRFPSGLEVSKSNGRCILSNCSSGGGKQAVRITDSIFVMTSAVDNSGSLEYVTVVFGINDDLKATIVEKEIEENPNDEFTALELIRNSINDDDSVFDPANPRTLWHARLFPGLDTMEASFDWTLARMNSSRGDRRRQLDPESKRAVENARFYSMHELVTLKNVEAILDYRRGLCEDIRLDLMKGGAC